MSRRCLCLQFLVGAFAVAGCGSGESEILPQPSPEEAKAQVDAYKQDMMAQMKKNRRPVPKQKPSGQ